MCHTLGAEAYAIALNYVVDDFYKIKKVDAYVKPELFTLEDLMKTEVKGKFYQKQLRLAPNASDSDLIFEVENVLKKKLIQGKEFYFVKYLYYPGLLSYFNGTVW